MNVRIYVYTLLCFVNVRIYVYTWLCFMNVRIYVYTWLCFGYIHTRANDIHIYKTAGLHNFMCVFARTHIQTRRYICILYIYLKHSKQLCILVLLMYVCVSVYACVCVYIKHTYIHTYIHIYTYTDAHTRRPQNLVIVQKKKKSWDWCSVQNEDHKNAWNGSMLCNQDAWTLQRDEHDQAVSPKNSCSKEIYDPAETFFLMGSMTFTLKCFRHAGWSHARFSLAGDESTACSVGIFAWNHRHVFVALTVWNETTFSN